MKNYLDMKKCSLMFVLFFILLFASCDKVTSEENSSLIVQNKTVNIIHEKEDNVVIFGLNEENNFTDIVSYGYFSRSGRSGPGTGPFVGKNFEFAKGACDNLDKQWLKTDGWRSYTLGCSDQLFESKWCARLETNYSINYTLEFKCWVIANGEDYQGDCKDYNFETTYVRTNAVK